MSAKNKDNHNRWRSVTIGFRVSPEKAYRLDMLAKASGMLKQHYILKRLLCEDIIVHLNIRVQKFLAQYLVELTNELKRIEKIGQDSDVLEDITYLVELISKKCHQIKKCSAFLGRAFSISL